MGLDFQRTRDLLADFQFDRLFIEELGWNQPLSKKPVSLEIENQVFEYSRIAEISGVVIFEVTAKDGEIPEAKFRKAIHQEISEKIAENLLIFVDRKRSRSWWYWVKREENKRYIRDHLYVKGQPGDLFLGKLSSLVCDLAELELGEPTVVEIARKLHDAFDVEKVTKKFYKEFQEEHLQFLQFVRGIDREVDRRWYASVILNRLMFVYFLQRKGFIDRGDLNYLQNKLAASKQRGKNRFFSEFLQALFFEAFAKLESDRDPKIQTLVGNIKYLNGGLFLKHRIEREYPHIAIADEAFDRIFTLFSRYSWNLDDTPGGKDDEINPDVLGYIFEKYINQKAFGAYYTRPEITEYLCDRTINKLIVDRVNAIAENTKFTDIKDILNRLDANLCSHLIDEILPSLSLLDPACGSGAFLVAAMKSLISIYSAIVGRIKLEGNRQLKQWLKKIEASHPSLSYFIKKRIITDNLYGVDLMEEATEIAKLRLFLVLVASAQNIDELEPLPNIDFNIMAGNSLIGLIRVNEESFDTVGNANILQRLDADNYRQILAEKNRSIELYKNHAFQAEEIEGDDRETRLQMLRNHIEKVNEESIAKLNQLLLDEFSSKLKIKYEEAQLKGKAKKRFLKLSDIEVLKPFHWGYHFDKIIEERGGFDAIITNPPWETFKPQAKEFFAQYSDLVTKNKMDIKTFEKEQSKLLANSEIARSWLEYQSQYPHVSLYYRSAEQYKNQISLVNGKKQGTDINLYKLFVEQCFNLLRPQGECGIVIPSGIYTDLGTKQLREMLFNETKVTGLFCLENRKRIFEDVHRSFKIVVLTFEKNSTTQSFTAKFMRHDVEELQNFPDKESIEISIDLIRQLSPDSLSVLEFKTNLDIHIAEKMTRFPLLGEKIEGKWNLRLTSEFHMTNDSHLFKTEPSKERLPLYEGKMLEQFTHTLTKPRYWIEEVEGRQTLLGKQKDNSQILDYQIYRVGFRKIARNTDTRTLISTIIPLSFHSENFQTALRCLNYPNFSPTNLECLYLVGIWNSFVLDYAIRFRVSANINFFYVYQLPVPRLTENDRSFKEIVERAAKLICTTPEFDELAKEVGLESYKNGVTDETERSIIKAELDAIIAHLYALSETEFQHILSTFPLVPEETKQATLAAYKIFAPLTGDPEIIDLISQGESSQLEFKSSARWDLRENKKNKAMEQIILKTVAAFLNSQGGTLLIGINDNSEVIGLDCDYQTFSKTNKRDAYELFLTNDLLLKTLGKDLAPFIAITFHQVERKDICRISIQPSPRIVCLYEKNPQNGQTQEYLYIRTGNSTNYLENPSDIQNYCKNRWN